MTKATFHSKLRSLPLCVFLFAIALSLSVPVHAQKRISKEQSSKKTANIRDAEFPGGKEQLKKYLTDNLRYPEQAKEDGIEGRVFLSFIITEKGKIEDIRIVRDLVAGCGAEALRVIKQMPLWHPALLKGKPIRTLQVLPVVFKIDR
ncbi:energy transducer TonB [Taibaiella lutea]|uniref:Energy transducer TonB n=1 Tax=Taibaiella lutea TaxID=2608001 RepID=A0A5M6CQ22_9BACT|nr:energy transducer TonB [Taibaiella lutea]KAA5537207.1 energy transducer TonB [Taibaiella lutea]